MFLFLKDKYLFVVLQVKCRRGKCEDRHDSERSAASEHE